MLTIERSLNVYAAGIPQIINLSQYDDDFQLVFSLYTSEGVFTVPSGTTAEIMGTKVDGNGYSADATVSGSTVTVTGNVQMTACAGRNVFEIVLTNSGKRLATINFILQVERAALDADTIQSETVLKELNAIIESAATSTQAAEDAEDAADRAEEAARTLTIDPTLTQSGQAADAKVTGDEIAEIKEDLAELEPGLSDGAKIALLDCFKNVVWKSGDSKTYYDALESALYAEAYPRIAVSYNPETHTVYTDDSLNSIKPYLSVYYYATKESEAVVVPSTDYALSGELKEGASTIVLSYNNVSTTVTIPNVVDFYNIWTWNLGDGLLQKVVGSVDMNQSDTTKYPSKAYIRTDVTARRNFNVTRGILPYYLYNQTAVSSGCYPIPVPKNANHMKITLTPSTQYIFAQVFAYNASNNTYNNSLSQNRITWANGLGGGEIDIDRPNGETSMFLCINTKYDSAGTSYPTEPTGLTIEFSEV